MVGKLTMCFCRCSLPAPVLPIGAGEPVSSQLCQLPYQHSTLQTAPVSEVICEVVSTRTLPALRNPDRDLADKSPILLKSAVIFGTIAWSLPASLPDLTFHSELSLHPAARDLRPRRV